MARDRDHRDDRDDYDDRPARRGPREDIPTYLVPSILVTLFCCLIGGIIAIINAASVNSKLAAGDVEGARKASANAKMWCMISVGVGLVVNIIVIVLNVLAVGAGAGGR